MGFDVYNYAIGIPELYAKTIWLISHSQISTPNFWLHSIFKLNHVFLVQFMANTRSGLLSLSQNNGYSLF